MEMTLLDRRTNTVNSLNNVASLDFNRIDTEKVPVETIGYEGQTMPFQ